MRIQDLPTRPHIDGYIFVSKGPAGTAHFVLTQTHHENFLTTSTPLLVQHPVTQRLFRDNRLQSIPVKVLFDTPENNISGRFEAWSDGYESGPVCLGDGGVAKALDIKTGAWRATLCKGPALCAKVIAGEVNCRFKAQLMVQVETTTDEVNHFEFSTNSMNSYLSILGNLRAFHALHGGLRNLPLNLVPWLKSTRASGYESFACAKLLLSRGGAIPTSAVNAEWEAHGSRERRKWLQECVATYAEQRASPPINPACREDISKIQTPRPKASDGIEEGALFARAIALNQAALENDLVLAP